MNAVSELTLKTSVQGRCLLRPPDGDFSGLLLVGFHGYGETAEDEMQRISGISGSFRWSLCSIEALHHFYNAKGVSGASWMTSRNRNGRIAENIRYVEEVIFRTLGICGFDGVIVLHGFSQGAGMACRLAAKGTYRVSGVMLLGGDIPPELEGLERMSAVHLARGNRDPLYAPDRFMRDTGRLRDAGVPCSAVTFTGSHAANEEYFRSAGEFLGEFSDDRFSPCSIARRDLPGYTPAKVVPRPAPPAP
jgi:predicted esterase